MVLGEKFLIKLHKLHFFGFLWFKNRDSTNSHNIIDTTRGTDKKLEGPDRTNAEGDTIYCDGNCLANCPILDACGVCGSGITDECGIVINEINYNPGLSFEHEDADYEFIGNDIILDDKQFLSIITGPNMAGKSTYLRQIGIIVIMAQIGCFVSSDFSEIGLIDQLFTRVGAGDNLAEGESTFLVEMQETANIINNATSNSLILLDEIGRGTSTYDGLSIAWGVTEHKHDKIKAKTLFATHYHELVELAENLDGANNLNILVQESSDQSEIVFLRKIIQGGTDKSYGI